MNLKELKERNKGRGIFKKTKDEIKEIRSYYQIKKIENAKARIERNKMLIKQMNEWNRVTSKKLKEIDTQIFIEETYEP